MGKLPGACRRQPVGSEITAALLLPGCRAELPDLAGGKGMAGGLHHDRRLSPRQRVDHKASSGELSRGMLVCYDFLFVGRIRVESFSSFRSAGGCAEFCTDYHSGQRRQGRPKTGWEEDLELFAEGFGQRWE